MPNNQFDTFTPNQVPFSLEAEQSVLGSIIIDPECIHTVISIIKPDYFYIPQHKSIFNVLYSMSNHSDIIDMVTLLENLKNEGVYDEAGGKQYISRLVDCVPTSANVASYANIVRDKYYARCLINAASGIIKDVEESASDVNTLISSAEQSIYEIRQGREVTGLTHISSIIINETLDRIDKMQDEQTKKDYIGIPTGLKDLDKVTTGLNKSDLIIIGARPGMGKTSFALNIARHVAVKEKKTVCFFSLEMSRDQLAQRLLSSDACVKSEKMRTGDLDEKELERIIQASDVLSKANLYVDETSNITVPEIKAKVRRLQGVDLVVIDYLQLMQSEKRSENRVQEVSKLTRDLKIMAKELAIPVVVLSQLHRGGESADGKVHRPTLSSLRESGSIEQDADIVLLLFRDGYKNIENENPADNSNEHDATCIVAKNRHGETADVKLYWDGQFTRFTSIANDKYAQ
ncbi:MAG: replicative DNA helicase [Acutalibacteraceae bacterium]|nr:replicative DNA helicase [Acutalibacteraceae bacterium]